MSFFNFLFKHKNINYFLLISIIFYSSCKEKTYEVPYYVKFFGESSQNIAREIYQIDDKLLMISLNGSEDIPIEAQQYAQIYKGNAINFLLTDYNGNLLNEYQEDFPTGVRIYNIEQYEEDFYFAGEVEGKAALYTARLNNNQWSFNEIDLSFSDYALIYKGFYLEDGDLFLVGKKKLTDNSILISKYDRQGNQIWERDYEQPDKNIDIYDGFEQDDDVMLLGNVKNRDTDQYNSISLLVDLRNGIVNREGISENTAKYQVFDVDTRRVVGVNEATNSLMISDINNFGAFIDEQNIVMPEIAEIRNVRAIETSSNDMVMMSARRADRNDFNFFLLSINSDKSVNVLENYGGDATDDWAAKGVVVNGYVYMLATSQFSFNSMLNLLKTDMDGNLNKSE